MHTTVVQPWKEIELKQMRLMRLQSTNMLAFAHLGIHF